MGLFYSVNISNLLFLYEREVKMYYRKRIKRGGQLRFEVSEKYKDPLTGKWKTATVAFSKDTSRARKQAERDLLDKIEGIVSKRESVYDTKKIKTFGELKEDWLASWSASVKPQTVKREKLVLKRLGKIIGDDFLLSKITPLLIKNTLDEYIRIYDPSHATIGHIRCSLNKVFAHGVLYGIIQYSPVTTVKVSVSIQKKREVRINREKKFLELHELNAFFNELSTRRNGNYYDLAIFLLFTGLRIGEASALTEEDIDFQANTIDVNKSLQSHDLRISEFYFDTTKTTNSERKVLLPKVAVEALKRVVERSRRFDQYAELNPSKSFSKSLSVFRTEYGAPITSHTFREVLYRVEKDLKENSKERYGFEWNKHVVPHSFRHMHITYLQSGDLDVALREIMGRVGHLNAETTMIYTHRTMDTQAKSIKALDKFAETSGIVFKEVKTWSCKYSEILDLLIKDNLELKYLKFSLDEFKKHLGLKESYPPRLISGNILHKVKRDLSIYHEGIVIETIRDGKQKVWGYEFKWT